MTKQPLGTDDLRLTWGSVIAPSPTAADAVTDLVVAPDPLPIPRATNLEPAPPPEESSADHTQTTRTILWGAPTADPPTFAYLAGPAGSGKTFLARQWAEETDGIVLCATTGIAAINLGGTTINALLGYYDTKSLQESYVGGWLTARLGKLWKAGVRQIVLDEVSMLGADALTILKRAIDEVNMRDYVLGKQYDEGEEVPQMKLLLTGDFGQLPPVDEPFAFESEEWGVFAEHTITLEKIWRQADPAFIAALRAARIGDTRAVLEYFGPRLVRQTEDTFDGSTIFAKNAAVDRYNALRLSKLSGSEITFLSRREGEQRAEWGNPQKPPATWGVPQRLFLKAGALVMILANKREEGPPPQAYRYVNGDLGIVEGGDERIAQVRLYRTDQVVPVEYVRREKLVPLDAARRKELRGARQEEKIAEGGKYEITGWIEYMPMRVAYATSTHKSQGLSLDRVQVNIGDPFFKTPGMIYVALSRCRTVEGLRIVGTTAALAERCTVHPKLVGRFL